MSSLSKKDINALIDMTKEVCQIIMGYYKLLDKEVETKSDNSPVTIADRHASDFLTERLVKILPSLPVVSEEGNQTENIKIIKTCKKFWLIDPIDGTWSFIRKKGVFTVNIALIENGKPIWGLIANPQDNAIYYNSESGQCLKLLDDNIEILRAKEVSPRGVDFLVSHQNLNQRIQDYVNQFKINTITPIPSSIKFALIADGKGDIYPRFKRTCIWDTAAGHALLNSIGGDIIDLEGNSLIYNSGQLENPDFIAVSSLDILKGTQPSANRLQ